MILQYKVSELLQNIKLTVAENFPLVDVVGEVFEVNINKKSGHVYFSLKEEKYALLCACWQNKADKYKDFITEGKNVKIRGRVLTFPSNGKVFIDVQHITTYETGDIAKSLANLTNKLQQEGLFAKEHKKPLPKFPQSIGVITSADGAVLGDILTTLQQTFPCIVQFYDVNVQGVDSIPSIMKALAYFQTLPLQEQPSFIIMARGGGALDDLFHFNNESLIRAMFNCSIPIISALGHESNTTLADLVADKAVVTPTASVLFLPKVADLLDTIQKLQHNQNGAWLNYLSLLKNKTSFLNKFLQYPLGQLNSSLVKVRGMQTTMYNLCNHKLQTYNSQLNQLVLALQEPILINKKMNSVIKLQLFLEKTKNKITSLQKDVVVLDRVLNSFSVKNTLKRGFSLIAKDGTLVRSAHALHNDTYNIEFFDSVIDVEFIIKPKK
ncbi:Exodeoxyribonuclease 7 large subunit [Candidatus Hepatincola sp. Pdp]